MEYKELHEILEDIFTELERQSVEYTKPFLNSRMIQVMNDSGYYITVHDIENLKPLFVNDLQRDYYGFANNHFDQKDYFFYFSTIHPSSISSLISSVVYFKNGGNDYLNLEYKLKKYNGKYEKFIGSTKSVFINNKIKYAISVLKKIQKSTPKSSKNVTAISLLTEREREIALLYCGDRTLVEISEELGISINTAKTHLKSIYRKLEINSVKELINEIKFLYP